MFVSPYDSGSCDRCPFEHQYVTCWDWTTYDFNAMTPAEVGRRWHLRGAWGGPAPSAVWLSGRGMPRLAAIVAAIPLVLSCSFYLARPYTGALDLPALGTIPWFLVASVLIGAQPGNRQE